MGHGLCQHTRGRAIDGDICFGEGYDNVSREVFSWLLSTWIVVFSRAVQGTGGEGGRRWHKLDWWHVGLVFGCLKRTGPGSLYRVSQGGCAWEGWGGMNCSLVIQDGHWPVCAAEIEVDTSCFSGSRLWKRFHSSLSKVILQLLIQDGK